MEDLNKKIGKNKNCPLLKSKIIYQNPHKSSLIFSFIQGTKTVRTTNLNTLQSDKNEIDSPDDLCSWNCLFQLPNNELFCVVNPDYFCMTGTAFIIDKNFSSRILSDAVPVWNGRASYLRGWIYLFCAFSEFSYALKYNLAKKKWVAIPYIPIGSTWVESMEFCGLILCSSMNGELVSYDPSLNSYSAYK